MKRYSVVMSCTDIDVYSLIISSYEIDSEGNRINDESNVYTGKTLLECKILIDSI